MDTLDINKGMKGGEKDMNKGIIIGVIVVLVVIFGGMYIANQNSQQSKIADEKAAMMKKDESNETIMKKNEEIMMMAQQDTTSKKATLSDVSGGTGTGKAFVLRKGGKLYYTATGNLPDPANGTFYEGWLAVKGANPPKFVDTGKLTKQKDGSYEVSYSSDNLYEGYDFVVITWEQVDDQKPEKHILEGLAQ